MRLLLIMILIVLHVWLELRGHVTIYFPIQGHILTSMNDQTGTYTCILSLFNLMRTWLQSIWWFPRFQDNSKGELFIHTRDGELMRDTEKTLWENSVNRNIHWGKLHVSQMKTQEVIKTVQAHWNLPLKERFDHVETHCK